MGAATLHTLTSDPTHHEGVTVDNSLKQCDILACFESDSTWQRGCIAPASGVDGVLPALTELSISKCSDVFLLSKIKSIGTVNRKTHLKVHLKNNERP